MGEMRLGLSNKVIARDTFGLFIRECEVAGENMMRDMAEDGADLSRSFAPQGGKPDPRTPHIVDSIFAEWSGTSARWGSTARHALPQEFGGRAHPISGWVRFFWEKEGRDWEPGPNIIDHPGNPAHPFLRPAYEAIMSRWMEYARRHYPR